MVKLAYLSDSTLFSGAANTIQVVKMAQALADEGHHLILHMRASVVPADWLDRFRHDYGVQADFEVRLWRLPFFKGHAYLYGLLVALYARIMYVDYVYCRSLPAFVAARLLGIPAVLELHQPLNDSQPLWFRRLIPLCWRDSDEVRLVAITSALQHELEFCYPELIGRIQVLPDGADPIPPTVFPCLISERKQCLQVGYTGQLYPGKGAELILALAPLCPWADFHLVGGRSRDRRFWRSHYGDFANVFWHDSVPHSIVSSYLVSFDVALLPLQRHVATAAGSDRDIARWTSPLKLFEYMSAGLAILSSDLPVLHDVLRDESNTLFCIPDNPRSWQAQLTRLRDDTNLRRALGMQAYSDFCQSYSWRARAREVFLCK